MRCKTLVTAMLLCGALSGSAAGCFFDYMNDCSYNIALSCYWDNQGGSGGTGGASPECIPSATNPEIAEDCGVFVSSEGSDVNGEGTKEKPYLTLGKAVSVGGAVYACAEEGKEFDEAVGASGEVTIYGGMDCTTDWHYDPTKKSAWTAPADTVPLRVAGVGKVEVYDFAITARNAEKAGGSSIGVLAVGEGVEVGLERCEVRAGDGQVGEAGTTPEGIGPSNEGATGSDGDRGDDGDGDSGTMGVICTGSNAVAGGNGGQNTCGGVDVSGGLGGSGTNGNGAAGLDGIPQPGPMPMDGKGGKGDDGSGCDVGNTGAKGNPGPGGFGGGGLGELTEAGYAGTPGQDGQGAGTPGQGGGGGGGAKTCGVMKAGPGGGGGGAGGCGGQPGTGGKAGGASLGVVSVNAAVRLTEVKIVASTGGAGGQGGNGQMGGSGGNPGFAGGAGACTGGVGGQGGRGGSGGGGAGGHAAGIAFTGTAPVEVEVTFTAGMSGSGGLGGDNTMTLKGEPGKTCETLDFEQGSCAK